ncbi:helix-turn-helix domain-containing protein [Embleya sp. NPDC008237]|uniref:helix-turn-helix domain-containing protein n=1 Tax=Embleya sp. NPDC008237 TaxID=3363978 RepID=UPI0036E6380E
MNGTERPDTSSARKLYATELRLLREAAGLTLVQVAEELKCAKTKIGDIESARRLAPKGFSEEMDAYYETTGVLTRMWETARREAHPDKYDAFMRIEAEARTIAEYAALTIPGLLQTETYARSLIRAFNPTASNERIDDLVAGRLARQDRLTGANPPRYWVILDEATIRRPVGGHPGMHEQLESLLPLVDSGQTTIQVLPFSHGPHPALGGSLTLLTRTDWSKVAYLEYSNSGQLFEDPLEADMRQQTYDHLRVNALDRTRTAEMITAAIREFKQ